MLQRFILVLCFLTIGGCVELGVLTGASPTGSQDATNPLDGLAEGGPATELAVRLTASNVVPQVNEQVFLTCLVVAGDPNGISIAFQSETSRLTVDTAQGRATFVVDQSDANTEIAFTCTGTTSSGMRVLSNRVVIIPIG